MVSFLVIICSSNACLSSVSPPPPRTHTHTHTHTAGFQIETHPEFFRVDSVTLNTPHTSGKSDKMIFRSTEIIRTLPRIVRTGEISPKSGRLSCGVHPALVFSCCNIGPVTLCLLPCLYGLLFANALFLDYCLNHN